MKKLVRKLALSCAALAVCAATLVSSTFAWYTTNTNVEANNVSGATADTGDASIFISGNGSNWYQKLDATSEGTDKFTITKADLLPVTLEDGVWKDRLGATVESPTLVTFTLYFKTAKTQNPVNLAINTITVSNTTGSVLTATNLLTGADYSQDIRDSLAMQIVSTTAPAALDQTNGYSLSAVGCVSEGGDAYADDPIAGGAHVYCNTVIEGSVTQTTTTTATLESGTVIAVLPANGDSVQVTFKIFLDGADTDCFDACKGQKFEIDLAFKSVA